VNGAPEQPLSTAVSSLVTDEVFEAAWEAESEAFAAYLHDNAGGGFVSTTAARRHSLRAAIEVAVQHAITTPTVTK